MADLDGNAIAGTLFEVFGREMTSDVGTCARCAWVGQMAETAVYLDAPGLVVRCPRCDSTLLVIVSRRDVRCVDLTGFSSLERTMPDAP